MGRAGVPRCDNCFTPRGERHEMWCKHAPDGLNLGKLDEEIKRLIVLEEIGLEKPVVVSIGGDYQRVTGAHVEFYRGQFVVVLET